MELGPENGIRLTNRADAFEPRRAQRAEGRPTKRRRDDQCRVGMGNEGVFEREREIAPVASARGVGLINAAAVALGLLTSTGSSIKLDHPATPAIRDAASRMVSLCAERGVDIAFVANQYSLQRSRCATTLIGTGKSHHLQSAVDALEEPLDEQLLAELLAMRPPVGERTWPSGLPENSADVG